MPRRPNVGYRCPVCSLTLEEEATGFSCPSSHRYDRAKEGYVNLLPSGRLRSRPSGDDEAMVQARRTVFDAGLYAPIIDAVATVVAEVADDVRRASRGGDVRILDCGSGEGSYLAAAADRADADGWGIDISKAAVRLAARRHRLHHYAVASSYQMPFDDDSFDVLMSVFSPRPHAEMMRVLDASGVAVVVRPGPEHLAELKALVYADPRQHRDPAASDGEDWPSPAARMVAVQFELVLDDPALRLALLEMTPYWWSARAERKDEIASTAFVTHADMRIAVFGHDG